MRTNQASILLTIFSLLCLGFLSCFHNPPPQELLQSRQNMEKALSYKAPQWAPDEYLAGKEAVKEAEEAWANDLFVYEDELRHKLQMALVRSEIAMLSAQDQANRKYLEDVNAQKAALLGKYERLNLREQNLKKKEKELDELERELGRTQARLAHLEKEREIMRAQLQAVVEKVGKIRQSERGLIVSLSNILFEFNRWDLKQGAKKNLIQLANILREYPDRSILLEGHTDSVGTEEYNALLSEKRAWAVRNFLNSMGISTDKLFVRGYGKNYPIASNQTNVGRQQNRRVDLVILDPDRVAVENFLDSPAPTHPQVTKN